MNLDTSKLIKVLDPQAGKLEETALTPRRLDAQDAGQLFEAYIAQRMNSKRRFTLLEIEEAVGTSEFPTLLRDGIRPILFDAYNMMPQTYQQWAATMQSDKPEENWLEGSTVGYPPIVGEGDSYPETDLALDRTVRIVNQKRGHILTITREMVMFDRVNQIQQQIADLGRALAAGHEQAAYDVLTTSGNYVRNSTTNDNNYGANTASTQFGPAGLVTAFNVLRTMKHRLSGRFLGIMPDTLIIPPDLEWAAKQLLFSDTLWRVGQGASVASDVYGTGTDNAFRGSVRNLIVSPFMTVGTWVLCEAKKAVVNQVVWGPELYQTTNAPEAPAFMERDSYRYRASEYYGIGMLNDRFAYLSTSSSAPIVN